MADGSFDTSGVVWAEYDGGARADGPYAWSDLSPFQQGYVEGLFVWWLENGGLIELARLGLTPHEVMAFHRLAPETVARILKDCEAFRSAFGRPDWTPAGAQFWRQRQEGSWGNQTPCFRPLTPYLGDDGLIYLREDKSNG